MGSDTLHRGGVQAGGRRPAPVAPSAAAHGRRDLPASSSPRLRGRDHEVACIHERVAALVEGRGGVLLITGAPGSGKTTLLDETAAIAGRAGVRICRGAGYPAGETVPLTPLLEGLVGGEDPVLDAAGLRRLSALPESRFWLLQELHERFERAALAVPVLVAIDDLHWADAATRIAVRTLTTRLAPHSILWVLSSRYGADRSLEDDLVAAGAQTLGLDPLDERAVTELAQDILGGVPDASVLELAAHTRGRPFLLADLLRGLREEGLVRDDEGRVRLAGRGLPVRLRDSVAKQLEHLSPATREAVQMGSILGRRFSVEHLAALLERPASALVAPVSEALASDLLVEHDDALAFRHDLLREAVDTSLPASLRRVLRRRALALMLEHDAPAAEIAALAMEVAEKGNRTAIAALRRAAAELVPTAPLRAADLSGRALELMPGRDPERPSLLAETISRLFGAGRAAEARALADTALRDGLEPEAAALVRLELAQGLVLHAFSEVVRQCRIALELPGLPEDLRLHLRITLTVGCIMDGGYEVARASVLENLADARAAGDRAAELAALFVCSAVCVREHRYAAALDYIAAAEALAVRVGQGVRRLFPQAQAGWVRLETGGAEDALSRSRSGLLAAQRDGSATDVAWWRSCRAAALLALGRLGDAQADAEAALDDLDPGCAAMNTPRAVLARIALHTGDRDQLVRAAATAAAMRADDSVALRRQGEWLGALLADAEGDSGRAMALLSETLAALGDLTPTLGQATEPGDLLVLLRVVLRAGEPAEADRVVRELERRVALNPGFALSVALAAHARGLLDRDVDSMRASVERLEAMPGPIARAEILEDTAGVLLAADRDEAVARLDAALDLFHDTGADRDAARVRRRLRELGVRRRRPAARRPASSWGGLSDSELAVVRLVARGATNRVVAEQLFLSPHTVSSHLRHAFDKLGVHSRVELAALVAQEGPLGGTTKGG